MRAGRLDTISLITDKADDDEYPCTCVSSGNLYLMANKKHPLAQKKEISIEDLKGQRFVSQGEEFDIHRMIDKACKEAGFELNVVYTGLDFFELAGQVNANVGLSYSLFPKASHYDASNIVFIPFRESFKWYALNLRKKV